MSKETKRNCIFTGQQATSKLTVGEDSHNWARSVPCTREYKDLRQGNCLSEDEMDAIALFYLIESHQLRLSNLNLELKKIQDRILKKVPTLQIEKERKVLEMESCYVQKDIKEEGKEAIAKVLEQKLKLWD